MSASKSGPRPSCSSLVGVARAAGSKIKQLGWPGEVALPCALAWLLPAPATGRHTTVLLFYRVKSQLSVRDGSAGHLAWWQREAGRGVAQLSSPEKHVCGGGRMPARKWHRKMGHSLSSSCDELDVNAAGDRRGPYGCCGPSRWDHRGAVHFRYPGSRSPSADFNQLSSSVEACYGAANVSTFRKIAVYSPVAKAMSPKLWHVGIVADVEVARLVFSSHSSIPRPSISLPSHHFTFTSAQDVDQLVPIYLYRLNSPRHSTCLWCSANVARITNKQSAFTQGSIKIAHANNGMFFTDWKHRFGIVARCNRCAIVTQVKRRVRDDRSAYILAAINRDPHISTQRIARYFGVSRSTIWRILHDGGLHPYHIHVYEALSEDEFKSRISFCYWFLNQNLDFLTS
ncbi:hypothetical protein PR048_009755 [Dryococelus australis]|uniref:Transposase Tc1-like domain-containing protein n=1 Tax=Dryococelus australis TaxID=614101 RepID=A0ABQ9I0U1_9NEOP|nr:hypothetical protein PR048_009755 [Dryococelus australis]